ncbi:kelch-like protein [bacterium]|nr:kelch-like protein [bacterium]
MHKILGFILAGFLAPLALALPPLTQATSSLGAVELDGYLYIYGGHAGKTHKYNTDTVLGTFQRLKLNGGKQWEQLPGGPKVQGMNLATHGGKIYRIGGLQPRNGPDEPADNVSITDCSCFDPKTNKWLAIAPLPAGRSSHDLIVAGDKLIVVGGWESRGKGNMPFWHETSLMLDLKDKDAKWESIPQPFKRRALTAAALGSKVYAICGMDENGALINQVDVYDLVSKKWSIGPALPGDKTGFSPAANIIQNKVIISTSEGLVFRLNESANGWEKVGTSNTKRIVHRLVPFGNNALLVGGAAPGGAGNFADLEVVTISEKDGKKP